MGTLRRDGESGCRTWWNVPREARIEPPSQDELTLSAEEAAASARGESKRSEWRKPACSRQYSVSSYARERKTTGAKTVDRRGDGGGGGLRAQDENNPERKLTDLDFDAGCDRSQFGRQPVHKTRDQGRPPRDDHVGEQSRLQVGVDLAQGGADQVRQGLEGRRRVGRDRRCRGGEDSSRELACGSGRRRDQGGVG